MGPTQRFYWITGSPSGVSRVKVVRRSSASMKLQPFAKVTIYFISINLRCGMSDYVKEVTSPAKFGSDPIWLFLIFVFIFFNRATASKPIFAHSSLKDAV